VTTDGTPPAAAEHLANADAPQERPTFDTSVAHIARVYDYWLGGKDNYAADRKAVSASSGISPRIA
jgi:hypothetical protein